MIFFRKPDGHQIRKALDEQAALSLSYQESECTRGVPPPGYNADHNCIQVGNGELAFKRAKMALLRWRMFEMPWVQLCWPNTPVQAGNVVGVLAHVNGGWWLNVCRVVYLFEETGEVERFGFAYGTLPEHAERGEERFMIEWRHADDTVWYDLLTYSQPNHRLARLGGPLARQTQKRFAADSKLAMVRAVGGTS
jgi:uncharacterized protein (UPF0548 family)